MPRGVWDSLGRFDQHSQMDGFRGVWWMEGFLDPAISRCQWNHQLQAFSPLLNLLIDRPHLLGSHLCSSKVARARSSMAIFMRGQWPSSGIFQGPGHLRGHPPATVLNLQKPPVFWRSVEPQRGPCRTRMTRDTYHARLSDKPGSFVELPCLKGEHEDLRRQLLPESIMVGMAWPAWPPKPLMTMVHLHIKHRWFARNHDDLQGGEDSAFGTFRTLQGTSSS